ncbi:unnamed protein product [Cunninghamella echinulata]
MRIFKIQCTSITVSIDRLSIMEENERFTLQHLIDSMTIQENGNKEALYVLQKKLKHGTNHQRLRVIEILNYLIENTKNYFLRDVLSNSKLISRLKWILKSSKVDLKVKKHLLVIMEQWILKYEFEEPKVKELISIINKDRHQVKEKSEWKFEKPTLNNEKSIMKNEYEDKKHFESFDHYYHPIQHYKQKQCRKYQKLDESQDASFLKLSPFSRHRPITKNAFIC